jgi:hypothetical protein
MASRPGLITAIGVFSIIVGSLSTLASLISIPYAIGIYYFASSGAMAMFSRTMATSANGVVPFQQQVVVSAVTQVAPLNPARTQLLKTLLAEQGQVLFPTGTPITRQSVQQSIVNSGTLPPNAGRPGAQYIMLKTGRIEIDDDYATVFPAAVAAEPAALATVQIDAIIGNLTTLASTDTQLDATQTATVRRELARPSQLFVQPNTDRQKLTLQIGGLIAAPDGGVTIILTSGGFWPLPTSDPTKIANAAAANPFITDTATTTTGPTITTTSGNVHTTTIITPAGTPPPAFTPPPGFQVMGIAAIGEPILSLALGIFLMIVGILVFKASPGGRKHHWWFVYAKIPLVILYFASWMVLTTTFFNGMFAMATRTAGATPPGAASALTLGMSIWLGGLSLLALAYPISLIFVLRSRSVREWYSSMGG